MKFSENQVIALIIISILALSVMQTPAFGHRSGCHRWHSCPSDTGSYTCGDTGHCSECSDNNYCKSGQPFSSSSGSSPKSSLPSTSPIIPPTKRTTVQPTQSTQSLCHGTAMCIVSIVQRIIDGDTIVVNANKIRLSLTNTPETNQKGFKEATTFTAKLCSVGSKVIVDQDDGQPIDKYGRIVGKITCSGKNLNAELLYNGYGTILKQYCKKSEFSSEAWAKKYGC